MSLLFVEQLKDKFGTDKEAVELYQKETGTDVSKLYKGTYRGELDTKGALFEFFIFKNLYKVKGYKKFLFNVYLPTKKGSTEVDVIMIHEKGIYVFECKNYCGKIYGKEEYKMWTQYLGGKKSTFYNPIKQNHGHIEALKEQLNEDEADFILSFICFSNNSELKVDFNPKRLYVGHSDDSVMELKILLKRQAPSKFSEERVDDIYKRLKEFSNVTSEYKEKHIERINEIKGNRE